MADAGLDAFPATELAQRDHIPETLQLTLIGGGILPMLYQVSYNYSTITEDGVANFWIPERGWVR